MAAEAQGKQLVAAVRSGDTAFVAAYLNRGGDVNAKLSSGKRTLLFDAVGYNQAAMVKLLLEQGADVQAKNSSEETPLHAGCKIGCDLEIIEMLVRAGADVNAWSVCDTPLHRACSADNEDRVEAYKKIIRFLVQNGADLNAARAPVAAPEQLAAQEDDDVADTHWPTPSPFFRVSRLEIARCLVEECGINVASLRDHGDETVLHYAINLNPELVDYYVQKGVEVSARDNWGNTALHYAAGGGKFTVVLRFLQHGADVNAEAAGGWKPIHYACKTLDMIAILLIQWGARPSDPVPADFGTYHYATPTESYAGMLVAHVARLLRNRKPLGASAAWLNWLVNVPFPVCDGDNDVILAAPSLSEAIGRDLVRFRVPSPPLTREQMTAPLRDAAWERRKHLVHAYFDLRRRWKEAREQASGGGSASAGAGASVGAGAGKSE